MNQLDPQTMARLMQQAGPLTQQVVQAGQQPTYPQLAQPAGDPRLRPGRDNYEMQEQYVRNAPGQSVGIQEQQLQAAQAQQPAQGPVPANQQPVQPSPAAKLIALQTLYGRQ